MTDEEFGDYLARVNEAAEPCGALMSCWACGKPIQEEAVVLTAVDPPRWVHPECDGRRPEGKRLPVWGRFRDWLRR